MSQYFPKPYEPFGGEINVKVDLSNYTTKVDLKNATAIDTSKLVAKSDLVSLKAELDKLDIDKLNNVTTYLSNLKSEVDELDIEKLETTSVDLSKLSNVVKNDAVKKDVYNAKIKNIEDKIPDITNLATTNALTVIENKIPNASNLVKKLTITQILMKLKRQLLIIIMINVLLLQNFIR